ncbi:MAG: hypothetical protein ACR2PG_02180 [Hyphomicrobiaceae bacterium]
MTAEAAGVARNRLKACGFVELGRTYRRLRVARLAPAGREYVAGNENHLNAIAIPSRGYTHTLAPLDISVALDEGDTLVKSEDRYIRFLYGRDVGPEKAKRVKKSNVKSLPTS